MTLDINKPLVATYVFAIYASLHILSFMKLLPEDLLKYLIGFDAGLASTVVTYHFGSSASSFRKSEVIASQLPKQTPTP